MTEGRVEEQASTEEKKDQEQASMEEQKDKEQASPEEKKDNVTLKDISCCAYTLFYSILFLAYWFGSSRFDVDGDGDFDPSDVQAFLQDKGLFLQKNYARSETMKSRTRIAGRSKTNMSGTTTSPAMQEETSTLQAAQPTEKPSEVAADEQVEASEEPEDQEGKTGMDGRGSSSGGFFDRDGDGQVDARDLLFTKVEGGEAQEDVAMKALATGQIVPMFIIGECIVCFFLWCIWAIILSADGRGDMFAQKAGFDSFFEKGTDLRLYGSECENYRPQVWRWLTYQWTHVGAQHVLMNVFLNVMLGIPLEGVHGHLRLAAMFNAGVVGGAFANFWLDGHVAVVGCSGGCYSLIGIHVADLIMNWSQKKFRLPTFVLLAVLITSDVASNLASHSEDVSHAAHIGGAFMGLLIGICIGKNMVWKTHERVFFIVAIIFGLAYSIFSLVWLFTQDKGPQNIFDVASDQPGWCWTAQVFNQSFMEDSYQCVSCFSESCVAHWKTCESVLSVDRENICEQIGYFFEES
mmetsp:Transcript_18398/g.52759  ORF Transcript_18398/g.52759 Transcript_18398/m.52759 type:complete len:520 (-) Transcript_18398:180-1739(-)